MSEDADYKDHSNHICARCATCGLIFDATRGLECPMEAVMIKHENKGSNAKLAAPGTYRFVRFRGDVLMAEGVRVKAASEKEALEKAKKLYGPLQPNERFELMEFHAEGSSACVL